MILVDDVPICLSLEPPWRSNETNISCIPPGEYPYCIVSDPRYGHIILVRGVPGRTDIEVHPGIALIDTHGCILPYMPSGDMPSRTALRALIAFLAPSTDGILDIRSPVL